MNRRFSKQLSVRPKMECFIPLSSTEKLMCDLTQFGDENVIGLVIVECNDIEFTQPILAEALFYLYKRHPLLRAHLRNYSTNDPYLEIKSDRHATVDDMLFEWSRLESVNNLTRELEIFNVRLFDYTNDCLLWRFKVFEYQQDDKCKLAMALILPMFITDGINIGVLCIEIVNLINSLLNETECEEMFLKLDTIENLNVLAEKSGLMNDVIQRKINESIKIEKNNEVFFNFPEHFRNLMDSGLKINLMSLNSEISTSIIEYAKSNSIKLTGFLLASVLYALKLLYDENGLLFPSELGVYLPVSLRIRLNPNVDFSHMRMLISMIKIQLRQPNFGKFENAWYDSTYINSLIKEELRTDNGSLFKVPNNINEINKLFNIIEQQRNIVEEKLTTEDLPKKTDISFSNINSYLYRKNVIKGPLKITEIFHGDSLESFPTFLSSFIMHVSTWDNRIMFLLSTNRRAFASVYSDRYMQLLEHVLSNSFFS